MLHSALLPARESVPADETCMHLRYISDIPSSYLHLPVLGTAMLPVRASTLMHDQSLHLRNSLSTTSAYLRPSLSKRIRCQGETSTSELRSLRSPIHDELKSEARDLEPGHSTAERADARRRSLVGSADSSSSYRDLWLLLMVLLPVRERIPESALPMEPQITEAHIWKHRYRRRLCCR